MGHRDSDKHKESHSKDKKEKHEKSFLWFKWFIFVEERYEKKERHEKKTHVESLKESPKNEEIVEKKDVATPTPENEQANMETEEAPVRRIRTRSMDAAEADNLYAISRYRISPETVANLNVKGITELFPIQVFCLREYLSCRL